MIVLQTYFKFHPTIFCNKLLLAINHRATILIFNSTYKARIETGVKFCRNREDLEWKKTNLLRFPNSSFNFEAKQY